MSGITEEDIDKFEAAFYGEKAKGTGAVEPGHLTADRLRRWCASVGVEVEDARIQVCCVFVVNVCACVCVCVCCACESVSVCCCDCAQVC